MGQCEQPDGGLPGETRVCLVATRPETFEACREGVYPCPRSYDRADAEFSALAFYRTAPVSAVTHYAPVTDRVVERRGEATHLTEDRWARLLDPVAETDEAMAFELGDLRSLARPVESDGRGVRGAWYPTLAALREAETLTALRERL